MNSKKLHSIKPQIIDYKNDEVAQAISKVTAIAAIDEINAKDKTKDVINWQMTPSTDLTKLLNQYLMLSKIRLTSK